MFLMLFAMAVIVANAQEETDVIKQSAGDKNLELQFNPGAIFGSNSGQILSNGVGIRFRLFASETIAYRLNLNLNYFNSSTTTQDADPNTGALELKTQNSSIGISLRPGIEKHFAGTKRLSPYVGAEAIIGYRTSTEKEDIQPANEKYVVKTVNGNLDDGFNLGVGLVAGADFYIAPKLYLGVELNYGLNYFMASKMKYSSSAPNTPSVDSKFGKTNTLTFQPGSMGIFRLGFLF